ncbi:MAG: hypothetical protein U0353_14230 [Sandaracinus sp.]
MRAPHRLAPWLLVTAIAATGCAPSLVDGRYACPDGLCPSGWFCHADGLCRQAMPSDGGVDGSGGDAQVAFLTPCTDDATCGGMRCYRGAEGDWPTGFCSPRCGSDPDCSALPHGPVCDDGPDVCIVLCDDIDGFCPTGLRCVGFFRDSTDPVATLGDCRATDAPIAASSQTSCTADLDCFAFDEFCAEGRCARPCSLSPALPCATSESCVTSAVGLVCRPRT